MIPLPHLRHLDPQPLPQIHLLPFPFPFPSPRTLPHLPLPTRTRTRTRTHPLPNRRDRNPRRNTRPQHALDRISPIALTAPTPRLFLRHLTQGIPVPARLLDGDVGGVEEGEGRVLGDGDEVVEVGVGERFREGDVGEGFHA